MEGYAPAPRRERPRGGQQAAAHTGAQIPPSSSGKLGCNRVVFPNEWAMQLIAKNREVNREAQLAEIERQGEEQIRVQLTQKGLSEERTALARDKERAREAREEAFRLEQA